MSLRFAPSPTGYLHLGNVRTALFNFLLAKQQQADFIVRIEDTDKERCEKRFSDALIHDLTWLGLWHDAGTVLSQSDNNSSFAEAISQLLEQGNAYPCFCTDEELALQRRAQRQQHQAPRYDRTCDRLTQEQRAQKLDEGRPYAVRFKIPAGEDIVFTDLIRGEKRYHSNDLGDFVIARRDGTPAFLLSNALDDWHQSIQIALRGEDHLSNTPRQLLIINALGGKLSDYGHLPLIVQSDGQPLSKRHGTWGIGYLRELGVLPQAILNALFRLGHNCSEADLLSLEQMAQLFDLRQVSHNPSRWTNDALAGWQKKILATLTDDEIVQWLSPVLESQTVSVQGFVSCYRDNILYFEDSLEAYRQLSSPLANLSEQSLDLLKNVDSDYFTVAEKAFSESQSYQQTLDTVKSETRARGKLLYGPMRIALSGQSHGPELADIVELLSPTEVQARLGAAAKYLPSIK